MSDVPAPPPASRRRRGRRRRTLAVAATAAVAVGGAAAVTLTVGTPEAEAGTLVPFDDCTALGRWYADTAQGVLDAGDAGLARSPLPEPGLFADEALDGEAPLSADAGAEAAGPEAGRGAGELADAGGVGTSESGTNVQEAGVDEPAPLKTDGRHVYATVGDDLVVTRLDGADTRVVGRLSLATDDLAGPTELLLAEDRVVVLSSGWLDVTASGEGTTEPDGAADVESAEPPESRGEDAPAAASIPAPVGSPTTVVTVVDVSDPTAPERVARDEVEGTYLSARATRVGERTPVRLVVSHTPTLPLVWPGLATPEAGEPLDAEGAAQRNREIVDGTAGEDWLPQRVTRAEDGSATRAPLLTCDEVSHPEEGAGLGTLTVLTLDPGTDADGGELVVDRDAVSADGQNVYAATDRLYVATTTGGWLWGPWDEVGGTAREVRTDLHGFDIGGDGTETTYLGSASVDGWLLGRWALSSTDGHLRVATTTEQLDESGPLPDAEVPGGETPDGDAPDVGPPDGEAPGEDVPGEEAIEPLPRPLPATESSIHVLAETGDGLEPVGRVDGLGPTEEIRSVRWFGDLAVVVTFRQTDPLYTIDLSDPTRPRVLGELKVTGYSGYLHPVGDDRLLGIGQEATPEGVLTGGKAELYDLSDLDAPRAVASLVWPDESPTVEADSRRFSYLPERDLALLDVESWAGVPLEDGAAGPDDGVTTDRPAVRVWGPALVAVSVGGDGSLTESGRWWSSDDPTASRRDILGHVAVADTGVVAVATTDWLLGEPGGQLTVLDLDDLSPVAEVDLG